MCESILLSNEQQEGPPETLPALHPVIFLDHSESAGLTEPALLQD